MSFHKKNIHSLPQRGFFGLNPPPPPAAPNPQEILLNFHILSLQFGLQAPLPLQISSEPLQVPSMVLFLEIYQAGINCSFWSLNDS